MKLRQGLMTGQVLQRDAGGRGAAVMRGTCRVSGTVALRVLKSGKVVRGFEWQGVGVADGKRFDATLSGLRSGGPYRVELRIMAGRTIEARLAVDDIYVGDVWILAGQSNMEGIGNLVHAPKPHPQVRAFFMRDEWGMAEEKLHYLGEAVDKVHNTYGNEPGRPPKAELEKGRAQMVKGTSPGLAFALDMLRRSRVPQGVIPCAHGGTSMAQWSPDLRDKGGASLYGAMMRRYEKLGQPIAGVLWYQGESDANTAAAKVYTDKMIELVAATRRDMALPKLPWVIVQLGSHAAREDEHAWNNIQEQQRLLPQAIVRLDVAPAVDLELDDGIHIGGMAQQQLGRRLARLADRLVHKTPGVKAGITLRKIDIVPTPHSNVGAACSSVALTYGNVAGALTSAGRPTGFALLDAEGRDVKGIFKTTVNGSRVLLHTNMSRFELGVLSLSYGHGRQPYCNIADRDALSIPVIQAVPIEPHHMRVCSGWQTALLPGVTSIAGASFAKANAARGWTRAPARAGFGVLPKPAHRDQLGVYAMRTSLNAAESLEAVLFFGANAPFKIWLNGKRVLADAKAAPPLTQGQYTVPLSLTRGKNALLVAFAPHVAGAHVGIIAYVGTPHMKAESRITLMR